MKTQTAAIMITIATILTALVTQIAATAFSHDGCKSVPQEETVTCYIAAQERETQDIDTDAITEALNASVTETAQLQG